MTKNVSVGGAQPFHFASVVRWRQCIGWVIVLGGIAVAVHTFYLRVSLGDPRLGGALLGGLMAALATALGTLPVLLSQQFSSKTHDTMLGFGAGVMLAASAFSLVLPALNSAQAQGASEWEAGGIVGCGILLGAVFLMLIGRAIPQDRYAKDLEVHQAGAFRRVWLFVFAISLHNLPEGLAIGVAFSGPDPAGAAALTTGLSLQNVPEGMVVALALRGIGYGRWMSAGFGVLSGMLEPLAAVFGVMVMGLSESLLPWGLAVAAGAMLFVISHYIIPEATRKSHATFASSGLMMGFVIMTVLDTALG